MRLGLSAATATLLLATSVLLATSAWAQQKPMINQVTEDTPTISGDDESNDTPILRKWRATVDVTQTHEFEINFADASGEADKAANNRVTMHTGLNEGLVTSGQEYSFEVVPSELKKARTTTVGVETVDIVLRVYRRGQRTTENAFETAVFSFKFDTDGPDSPTIKRVTSGERRLEVAWEHGSTDLKNFEVRWHPDVDKTRCTGTATRGASATDSNSSYDVRWPEEKTNIPETQDSIGIEDDIVLGRCVEVVVFAYDQAGNRSPASDSWFAESIEVLDFWDEYQRLAADGTLENTGEDGGFCFVATAAHGTYAHPVVQALRWFRDGVLRRTPIGQAAVHAYYTMSPPLAAEIAQDDALADGFRLALVPIALAAMLLLLAPFAGLIALLWIFRRELPRWAGATSVALLLVLAAPSASAAPTDPHDRSGGIGFGFEFKGGLFLPAMADEYNPTTNTGQASAAAFRNIFLDRDKNGNLEDPSANPLYTIGFDVHLYEGLGGSIGAGGTFGFMQFVGRGLGVKAEGDSLADRTAADARRTLVESSDTTVLHIAPLTLTAFYRFHLLRDELSVPIVPYVRGGLAYTIWAVGRGDGGLSTGQPTVGADEKTGIGGKAGLTATGGLAITLDSIDPKSARRLYVASGIRSTSVFVEYYFAWVDGFGSDGFDFSEDSWNAGLYLEF